MYNPQCTMLWIFCQNSSKNFTDLFIVDNLQSIYYAFHNLKNIWPLHEKKVDTAMVAAFRKGDVMEK